MGIIERKQAQVLLEIVDRYLYDHMRDPQSLTPVEKERYAQIAVIQADLLQVAHGTVLDDIDDAINETESDEGASDQPDQPDQTDAAPKPKPRRLRK